MCTCMKSNKKDVNELLDLFKLSEGLKISERKGLNGSMESKKGNGN